MADHGNVEYGVATGNDLAAHEDTYAGFVQLAYIGTLHVVNIAIGLCIGGVLGNWLGAVTIFVFASLDRRPRPCNRGSRPHGRHGPDFARDPGDVGLTAGHRAQTPLISPRSRPTQETG